MAPGLHIPSYTPQTAYDDTHKLLLLSKLSHYKTKSYALHEAFGRVYDDLNGLLDKITEQLIGYSDADPVKLNIGVLEIKTPKELSAIIIDTAGKLKKFAAEKEYDNIENLAQELSGVGAQLKYLSRFP